MPDLPILPGAMNEDELYSRESSSRDDAGSSDGFWKRAWRSAEPRGQCELCRTATATESRHGLDVCAECMADYLP